MAIRISTWLAMAVLAATPGDNTRGDEKLALPKSPPPVFGIARLNKAGKVDFEQTVTTYVVEKRARVTVQNGRKVTVEYSVYVPVQRAVTSQLEIEHLAAFIAPQKTLSAGNLRDELAKPRAAVMTTNGRNLDPYFVRLLKPGTLIIVNKRQTPLGPIPRVVPQPKPVKLKPQKTP